MIEKLECVAFIGWLMLAVPPFFGVGEMCK